MQAEARLPLNQELQAIVDRIAVRFAAETAGKWFVLLTTKSAMRIHAAVYRGRLASKIPGCRKASGRVVKVSDSRATFEG
jgi:hypothetical protein